MQNRNKRKATQVLEEIQDISGQLWGVVEGLSTIDTNPTFEDIRVLKGIRSKLNNMWKRFEK